MPRELEDAKHPEDSERDERAAEILVVCDAESDVVRQDGDDIDDAHDRAHVAAAVWRGEQSQQVLASEDHDAGRVEAEQFHLEPFSTRASLPGAGGAPARHSLGHVDDHRHSDEEPGHVVEDERRCAAVRVLQRSPHPLSRRLSADLQLLLRLPANVFMF